MASDEHLLMSVIASEIFNITCSHNREGITSATGIKVVDSPPGPLHKSELDYLLLQRRRSVFMYATIAVLLVAFAASHAGPQGSKGTIGGPGGPGGPGCKTEGAIAASEPEECLAHRPCELPYIPPK